MDNIKDIVHQVIENISSQSSWGQERVHKIWDKILDESARKHTQFSGIKEDKILIYVDSPVWLYQLNLMKKKILQDLQKEIPEIKFIYFKIGKV